MHGESAAIVALLTRVHGRHLGLVPGGAGRRARGLYEPGNRLRAVWRARLAEHLGHYACELVESRAAALLEDGARLAALTAVTALVDAALPEREPHGRVFAGLDAFIAGLQADSALPAWAAQYVHFELALLADLGFGLDLARCAATGATEGLTYVSPKTGRAVSAAAAAPYRDRLLPLPAFLLRPADVARGAPPDDILAGLALTGYFLAQHVFSQRASGAAAPQREPPARERLVAQLQRALAGRAVGSTRN